MKSLGRRATIVVAAVACLAVLAGGWFLLIQPARSDIAKTKSPDRAAAVRQPERAAAAAVDAQHRQAPSGRAGRARRPSEEGAEPGRACRDPAVDAVAGDRVRRAPDQLRADGSRRRSPSAPGISTVEHHHERRAAATPSSSSWTAALEGLQRTFMVTRLHLHRHRQYGEHQHRARRPRPVVIPDLITATFTGRVLVHTDGHGYRRERRRPLDDRPPPATDRTRSTHASPKGASKSLMTLDKRSKIMLGGAGRRPRGRGGVLPV